MPRDFYFDMDAVRPKHVVGFDAWIFWGHFATIGERRSIFVRVLGLEAELSWQWMNAAELEQWNRISGDHFAEDARDY